MTVVLVLLSLVAVALPWVASHYLARLPYAPECPCCRTVTSPPRRVGWTDRVCAVLAATPVRSCTRCGWAGRMRWRLAVERAHRHRHG